MRHVATMPLPAGQSWNCYQIWDVTMMWLNERWVWTMYSITGGAQLHYVWQTRHMSVTPVTPSQTWDMQTLIHNTVWQPI